MALLCGRPGVSSKTRRGEPGGPARPLTRRGESRDAKHVWEGDARVEDPPWRAEPYSTIGERPQWRLGGSLALPKPVTIHATLG